ncbi:MAG: hypothetical protein ACFFDF_14430, partial [Candidatus Odinarchaeota archaeon]
MPDDKEKIEDFISLWRKKMESERDKPSVIGETLEKIKEVEKENELLRNKIKDNIELISKTEKVIKSTIEENEMLKSKLRQGGISIGTNGSEIQKKNIDFNNKLVDLEKKLAEKEVELRAIHNEKIELETKLEAVLKPKVGSPSINSGQPITSIDDMKSELAKRKNKIDELVNKVSELTEENEVLNQQLVEKMKALPIDYVVPVEQSRSPIMRSQSTQASTETLERLCQDLQQDLNKYKRIIETLNKEKGELQEALISGGFQLEPEEIKLLKKENDVLKNNLAKLQESLNLKQRETTPSLQLNEKINYLQEQIKERDNLIRYDCVENDNHLYLRTHQTIIEGITELDEILVGDPLEKE